MVVVLLQGCIRGLWAVNTNEAVQYECVKKNTVGFIVGTERSVGVSLNKEVTCICYRLCIYYRHEEMNSAQVQ